MEATTTRDDTIPFPTERAATSTYIQAFSLSGHDPFVCGANGQVTAEIIAELERGPLSDACDKGDGDYLFLARWCVTEYRTSGRELNSGYWELDLLRFQPLRKYGARQTEPADLEALWYERTRSPAGDAVRVTLEIGHSDCPNVGCHSDSGGRCCAGAVCDATSPNSTEQEQPL